MAVEVPAIQLKYMRIDAGPLPDPDAMPREGVILCSRAAVDGSRTFVLTRTSDDSAREWIALD